MSERLYFTGIGASPGIAVGKAVVLDSAGPAVFRVPIPRKDVDREVERLDVRKVLQGKRRSVLHLIATSLDYTPSESEPSEPFGPSREESYLAQSGGGSQNGSQIGDGTGKVSHESEPRTPVAVSEEGDDGSHGSHGSQGSQGSHGSQGTGDDQLSDARDGPALRSIRWEEEL